MKSESNNGSSADSTYGGRQSIRLKGYDYTQPGGYFVTLVTFRRECLFGEFVAGEMTLTPLGRIAQECWQAIPDHFPGVELGVWVVMPNHVHGIIVIHESVYERATQSIVGATQWVAPPNEKQFIRLSGPKKGSLGAIIGAYKMAVTRRAGRELDSANIWQRNYYEHILRDQSDWERVSAYILANPALWLDDMENPTNFPPNQSR